MQSLPKAPEAVSSLTVEEFGGYALRGRLGNDAFGWAASILWKAGVLCRNSRKRGSCPILLRYHGFSLRRLNRVRDMVSLGSCVV